MAAEGRVQSEGSDLGVPNSAVGVDVVDGEVVKGVGVVAKVSEEVADEGEVVFGVMVSDMIEV